MTATRDDVMVLLKLDEVYKPGTAARKFAYSDRLAEVVATGTFFDEFALDSDERFWVNEVATYCELLATLWEQGIVDRDLAVEWSGVQFYWDRIGPILIRSRDVFDHDQLWTGFEALAAAQKAQ
jgi:hypothetical protein